MPVERKIRQFVLIAAAALTIAVPAAGATAGDKVQIAGKLVAPSQVSATQEYAGTPQSAHLVQINGELIPPSELSSVEAKLSAASTTGSSEGGFDWSATTIELALLGALALLVGLLGVRWRRGRLTTA
jgi:hypothetical protein